MEVRLRKPQRQIFKLAQKYPGSFFRKYKKSSTTSRIIYRLMDAKVNPIQNFNGSEIKPFIEKDLLLKAGDENKYYLKPDITLAEKKSKYGQTKQPA